MTSTLRVRVPSNLAEVNYSRVCGKSFHVLSKRVFYYKIMSQPNIQLREMGSSLPMAQILTRESSGKIYFQGMDTNWCRNYNEDRVAIILNIMKPKSKEAKIDYWPKCSFFGIYDGHGGSQCAEFLRDYLHQFV